MNSPQASSPRDRITAVKSAPNDIAARRKSPSRRTRAGLRAPTDLPPTLASGQISSVYRPQTLVKPSAGSAQKHPATRGEFLLLLFLRWLGGCLSHEISPSFALFVCIFFVLRSPPLLPLSLSLSLSLAPSPSAFISLSLSLLSESLSRSLFLSVTCLSACLSVYLFCRCACLSVCRPVCRCACLSLGLSVCLSVFLCVSVYLALPPLSLTSLLRSRPRLLELDAAVVDILRSV